jgi:Mn2+/Fe2+ NRAMP family transporter
LAKGWGKEHKKLARWDLGMTMFLPFTIVTSLIIVAMTVTGVYTGADAVNSTLTPLGAAAAFQGIPYGNVIFCLGLMGMCGGAVSVHMVACGFTMCEMLGLDMTQKRFRLFALTPCVGCLGVVISLPMWFPVVASAVCFTMLPIAYFIFLYLNNKRSYIGDAVGRGWKRVVFNVILVAALIFACIGSGKSIKSNVIDKLAPTEAPPVPAMPIIIFDALSDALKEVEPVVEESAEESVEEATESGTEEVAPE